MHTYIQTYKHTDIHTYLHPYFLYEMNDYKSHGACESPWETLQVHFFLGTQFLRHIWYAWGSEKPHVEVKTSQDSEVLFEARGWNLMVIPCHRDGVLFLGLPWFTMVYHVCQVTISVIWGLTCALEMIFLSEFTWTTLCPKICMERVFKEDRRFLWRQPMQELGVFTFDDPESWPLAGQWP